MVTGKLPEISVATWWARNRIDTSEEENNVAKRSAVSTGSLSALLHLHIRPIDLVVSQEPSLARKPYLGGSFTLICLQRLSIPHVATQRCD